MKHSDRQPYIIYSLRLFYHKQFLEVISQDHFLIIAPSMIQYWLGDWRLCNKRIGTVFQGQLYLSSWINTWCLVEYNN